MERYVHKSLPRNKLYIYIDVIGNNFKRQIELDIKLNSIHDIKCEYGDSFLYRLSVPLDKLDMLRNLLKEINIIPSDPLYVWNYFRNNLYFSGSKWFNIKTASFPLKRKIKWNTCDEGEPEEKRIAISAAP